MTPSLPELQRRFAAALLDEHAEGGLAVYRNTVFANYRNALAATFRVVRELTGAPFFDAAVDAFAIARPSTGGDLNVYGGAFPDFLAGYPHAKQLAYLSDVARLEWALDEAGRAADSHGSPGQVLQALAAVDPPGVVRVRFALDPSCRLLRSAHPVMRIWQAHQNGDYGAVDLGAGPDHLLVRREGPSPVIERLAAADFAFLAALASGGDLAAALEAALAFDADFELGVALPAHIGSGVLAELA